MRLFGAYRASCTRWSGNGNVGASSRHPQPAFFTPVPVPTNEACDPGDKTAVSEGVEHDRFGDFVLIAWHSQWHRGGNAGLDLFLHGIAFHSGVFIRPGRRVWTWRALRSTVQLRTKERTAVLVALYVLAPWCPGNRVSGHRSFQQRHQDWDQGLGPDRERGRWTQLCCVGVA